jgi:hypothetical protein
MDDLWLLELVQLLERQCDCFGAVPASLMAGVLTLVMVFLVLHQPL